MEEKWRTPEAFHRFNAFSEEFDRNIKVTFGCLEWLRSSKPHSTVKHAQLSTGGEPWGKSILLRDPVGQALSAVRFISTMGIIRVIAALEDYLTVLEADHSRTAFLRTNNCKLPRPVFASKRVKLPALEYLVRSGCCDQCIVGSHAFISVFYNSGAIALFIGAGGRVMRWHRSQLLRKSPERTQTGRQIKERVCQHCRKLRLIKK